MVADYVEPAATNPGDLTARARIRDAALHLFAERGFKGASIRDIAEAAGVSPGLVQHHFGTKDGLRQACDVHAVAVFERTKMQGLAGGNFASPAFIASAYQATLPAVRYMARALAEGSPGANALFDEMVRVTNQVLDAARGTGVSFETADPQAFAAVLAAQNLGIMVLHEHLARVLGVDPLSREGHPRVGLAMLEIYSQPLFDPELSEAAREGIKGFEAGSDQKRQGE